MPEAGRGRDRILFRLHDRARGKGQWVLECGEQRQAVQPAQPIFYLGRFPRAVPGYGAVPYGAGGQFANSSSNFYPVTAYLPKERDLVVSELQYIMDTVSEEEMVEYRRNLKSLG